MGTVQAPHSPMPQPNLVPVNSTSSRRTQRSGVSGSTPLSVCSVPLIFSFMGAQLDGAPLPSRPSWYIPTPMGLTNMTRVR
jgi:hypothetical protein